MLVSNDQETIQLLIDSGMVRDGLFCVDVNIPSLGFFAHLGGVMSMLRVCERLELTPFIRLSSSNYLDAVRGPNFLEYFFEGPKLSDEQRRSALSIPLTRIESFFDCPGWSQTDYPSLALGNIFWSKFYSLRPEMVDLVERIALEKNIGINTMGVHYRGTDKVSEADAIDPKKIVGHVSTCLALHPEVQQIFVATDSHKFLDIIGNQLKRYKVIFRDGELRSQNELPVHLSSVLEPFRLGQEALLNSLLLSNCGILVKNMSDLSGWSSVFNPSQKVYLVNRPAGDGIKWLGFPERELVEKGCFVPGLQ